jgi:hypothetical protein
MHMFLTFVLLLATSSRHRTYSWCVRVSTADFMYAFDIRIAWLLIYHLNNVLTTCMHALHACWRELVPGENWSLASSGRKVNIGAMTHHQ